MHGLTLWPDLIDPFGLCTDWDEWLDNVQFALESLGLIPGLEFADAFSGLLSLGRGDY